MQTQLEMREETRLVKAALAAAGFAVQCVYHATSWYNSKHGGRLSFHMVERHRHTIVLRGKSRDLTSEQIAERVASALSQCPACAARSAARRAEIIYVDLD